MRTYNRRMYQHGVTNSTAAAATLKALAPGRPIRVTGIGVLTKVIYAAGATTQSSLTIGCSAVGSTTDVVKETLDLTAGIAASTHVFKDMEALGTAFTALPGQLVSFKTNDTNSGGSPTGTIEPYFAYHEIGWARSPTYDVAYTAS